MGAETTIVFALGAVGVAVGAFGLWWRGRRRPGTIDGAPATKGGAGPGEPGTPASWSAGLERSRRDGFVGRLAGLLQGRAPTSALMSEVEEVLITADIGVGCAERLLEAVRGELSRGDEANVWQALKDEARVILAVGETGPTSLPDRGETDGPYVCLVLGVNGSGKTTTIGKLAHRLIAAGRQVHLVAGDTFRAAAAEQLEHWGRRVGAEVSRGEDGADPSSVVFEGLKAATDAGADVVMVDTAGRLHTQVNLMEELKKVTRVAGKAVPGAPHEVLLVVDATTGQNAIQQARSFHEACQVSGIVLSKLDGTAKGGVLLGVCDAIPLPVAWVGVGERVEDIRPFETEAFVDALFGADMAAPK